MVRDPASRRPPATRAWAGCSFGVSVPKRVGVLVVGWTVVEHRLEGAAQLADESHVLALDGQVRGVHLDQLADEDPGPGIGLLVKSVDVGDRRPDQVVHELKLAPDRDAELRQMM